MNTMKLPPLERIVFLQTGCKNKIKQLIAPEFELSVNSIESSRSYITIICENNKFCLTCNESVFAVDAEYVLLTNTKPTEKRLKDKSCVIKKWLKHPLLKEYSIDEIIASWKNNFQFKEENQQENIQGLRQPQLGALYAILAHLQLPLETATVVLPTGTGKTETMLSTLVANQCSKVLALY